MDEPTPEPASPSGSRTRSIKRVLIATVVGLIGGYLVWTLGSAVLPRWWAQRVGNMIDGRITAGTVVGLSAGAVFTIAPLLVLSLGWKFRKGPRRFLKFVVVALVLAAPNLATLGIVMGTGNAAHAGERILDVDGPGFRGGSLIGAIFGVLAVIAVTSLSFSRTRNKERARELKELKKARDNE